MWMSRKKIEQKAEKMAWEIIKHERSKARLLKHEQEIRKLKKENRALWEELHQMQDNMPGHIRGYYMDGTGLVVSCTTEKVPEEEQKETVAQP